MGKSKYANIEIDRLQMYFGVPYVIDCEDTIGTITVYEPTIGSIVDVGYDRFYATLNIFVTNTTSNRLFLWDQKLDWNEITDFQLFCLLAKTIDIDSAKLLFGDIDWDSFEIFFKDVEIEVEVEEPETEDGNEEEKTNTRKEIQVEQRMVFASPKENIEIDENVYEHIHQYLQKMFNMKFEDEFTNDPVLKKWWIEKDRRQQMRDKEKKNGKGKGDDDDKPTYPLQSLISAYLCHPGTKYKLSELRDVGVCEFYDSIQRLQIYESTKALMGGAYSGFADLSKVPKEEFDFMRSI